MSFRGSYGFPTFGCPVLGYTLTLDPFNRIEWWTTVVLPHPQCGPPPLFLENVCVKTKTLFELMIEGPTPENEQEERDLATYVAIMRKRQAAIQGGAECYL
jgi:hypothetical protein